MEEKMRKLFELKTNELIRVIEKIAQEDNDFAIIRRKDGVWKILENPGFNPSTKKNFDFTLGSKDIKDVLHHYIRRFSK